MFLAHDAGGAKLLSSMTLKEKDWYIWTVLALKLFRRRNIKRNKFERKSYFRRFERLRRPINRKDKAGLYLFSHRME